MIGRVRALPPTPSEFGHLAPLHACTSAERARPRSRGVWQVLLQDAFSSGLLAECTFGREQTRQDGRDDGRAADRGVPSQAGDGQRAREGRCAQQRRGCSAVAGVDVWWTLRRRAEQRGRRGGTPSGRATDAAASSGDVWTFGDAGSVTVANALV